MLLTLFTFFMMLLLLRTPCLPLRRLMLTLFGSFGPRLMLRVFLLNFLIFRLLPRIFLFTGLALMKSVLGLLSLASLSLLLMRLTWSTRSSLLFRWLLMSPDDLLILDAAKLAAQQLFDLLVINCDGLPSAVFVHLQTVQNSLILLSPPSKVS